jgi:hypothetical protein
LPGVFFLLVGNLAIFTLRSLNAALEPPGDRCF